MTNNHLRGPMQIVVNLTNNCNLRCAHCFYESGSRGAGSDMSDEEIHRLIDDISLIKPFNVCFFGGEPLLRKQLLLDCTRQLSSLGIRVNLITNGYFLDENTTASLIQSGIKDFQISIDGATPETHDLIRGVQGSFQRTLQAFSNLFKMKFPTYEASFTVNKYNLHELESLILLLDSLHVPKLFIRPLILIGNARSKKDLLEVGMRDHFRIWKIRQHHYVNPRIHISIDFYDPLSQLFNFPQKEYYHGVDIRANGAIILSPHLAIEVGNVRKRKLMEYWQAGLDQIWKCNRIAKVLGTIHTHDDVQKIYDNLDQHHFDLIEDGHD